MKVEQEDVDDTVFKYSDADIKEHKEYQLEVL